MEELTEREKEILSCAFRILDNLADLNCKLYAIDGIDRDDVFTLAEKLGIEY